MLRCALSPKLKAASTPECAPKNVTQKMQDVFLQSEEGKQIQDVTVWIQNDLKLQYLSSEVIMRAGSLCRLRCIPIGEPVEKDVSLSFHSNIIYFIYCLSLMNKPVFCFILKVVALYPPNQHLLHSCVPNTQIIEGDDDEDDKESFSSYVFARRDIPAGEPITFSYLSLALGTYSRRLILEEFGGCFCSRCLDKTELGLYVGSVCCEQCKGISFQ